MPKYALELVVFVLIAFWLLGLIVPFAGPFIHVLLLLVLVVVALRIIQGRKPAA